MNQDLEKCAPRQRQLYDVIVQYISEHGYSPSFRELCKLTGLKSTSTVRFHLRILLSLGLISYNETIPRSITVRSEPSEEESSKVLHIVTAIKDIDMAMEAESGVEVAGVFDSEEKAKEAKAVVEQWIADKGFSDSVVFSAPINVNQLNWYDIKRII